MCKGRKGKRALARSSDRKGRGAYMGRQRKTWIKYRKRNGVYVERDQKKICKSFWDRKWNRVKCA